MAKYSIEQSTLTSIGDAIREKTGMSELIPVNELASSIAAIQSGGADFNVSNLNGYFCINRLDSATTPSLATHTAWKSTIIDEVYTPSTQRTSSVGDEGTGLTYVVNNLTKLSSISSIDKINFIIVYDSQSVYLWVKGMPSDKFSDTIVRMPTISISHNSSYGKIELVNGAVANRYIGLSLASNKFYENFSSSFSRMGIIIGYED